MAENFQTLCRIELPAAFPSLPDLMASLSECARKAGFGEHKIGAIELAAEEAIVNIIKYSYAGAEGTITVICSEDNDKRLHIDIIDSGPPFNPLMKDTPDTASGIDDRAIGGLGIFFIKKMTDDVSYRREGNRNILSITVEKEDREQGTGNREQK